MPEMLGSDKFNVHCLQTLSQAEKTYHHLCPRVGTTRRIVHHDKKLELDSDEELVDDESFLRTLENAVSAQTSFQKSVREVNATT